MSDGAAMEACHFFGCGDCNDSPCATLLPQADGTPATTVTCWCTCHRATSPPRHFATPDADPGPVQLSWNYQRVVPVVPCPRCASQGTDPSWDALKCIDCLGAKFVLDPEEHRKIQAFEQRCRAACSDCRTGVSLKHDPSSTQKPWWHDDGDGSWCLCEANDLRVEANL